MGTELTHPRRKSVLAAVLLFPFRAVERARGWRRLGLLVVYVLAANDLAWCDQPQRPAFAVPRLRIYQSDPAARPAARALPPEELARWAESILIHPALPWRMGVLELFDRTDRWSLGQLKEAVAVPLFTREMGRRPASPAEALLRYPPLPGDTPDRDQAEPVPERAGKQPPR
jgi:hypothetical protein